MKALTLSFALLVSAVLAACGGSATGPNNGQPNNNGQPTGLNVTSGAFDPGAAIPSDYTCDAGGLQPPVSWTGAPTNSAEYALVMDDTDANGFVHWVVVGIPGDETALSNPLPDGAVAGVNGKGTAGYTPPCPPSGTHHYVITVYALSSSLGLGAGATADQVRSAAANKTLAVGTLTGTYSRGGPNAS